MSQRNGDRARFHKDRQRKLRHRQRVRARLVAVKTRTDDATATRAASLAMSDEGGPARSGD
jgi:hypothetical protein